MYAAGADSDGHRRIAHHSGGSLHNNLGESAVFQRIARGAGVDESEVKDLLKYYNNTRKTMKGLGKRGGRLSGGAMNRMMGQFMK